MNFLISFFLKSNNLFLFKFFWKISFLSFNKHKVWIDSKGNTLAHYACMHHNNELFLFSKKYPMDLSFLNKKGQAPLHIFIERAFFEQDLKGSLRENIKRIFYEAILFLNRLIVIPEKIITLLENHRNFFDKKTLGISYNEELLNNIIIAGANINQFMEFPDRKELGWNSSEYGSFSLKDNLGSPIELLVYFFWEFILYPYIKNKDITEIQKQYELFFHCLTKYGANINLIVKGDKNESYIQDIMESFPTRIVSVFFCRFIVNSRDYLAIRPLLEDTTLNFIEADDLGNTVLHTLFARLSARKEKISDEICSEIIVNISNNKNLTIEDLELKNIYGMTPLDLVRGEAQPFRKYLFSFVLNKQLQNTLVTNKVITKVNKI